MECFFPFQCGACEQWGAAPFCSDCEVMLEVPTPVVLPGYDFVMVRYAYGGPLMEAVQAFKFHGRFELGLPLGRRLAERWPVEKRPDVVIPMPSSIQGLRSRGYSPSRELARAFTFPVNTRAAGRQGQQSPQVGLSRALRSSNQMKAFRVDPIAVSGRVVLVVDDVVTTGATLESMGGALRAAGVRSCMAAVLARST